MQLRCICTSARSQASQMQIGRIVNKVINSYQPKKSQRKGPHNNNNNNSNAAPLPTFNPTSKKAFCQNTRRVTVLNKVFMKYITDLMATGEVASKLVGRGIEISHIKVAPDFKVINVYWYAENKANAGESTEKILKTSAGHLQHELSQLRVIGIVPPINFVKNKRFMVIKEVEDRLSKVDFGEDYVPTAYISTTQIPILQTSLSPEIKAKISKADSENIKEDENYEIIIPEMRQDIMGFDHSAVMKKIKYSLNKSKDAVKNRVLDVPEPNTVSPLDSQVTSLDVNSFLYSREEKKVFDDFIKKRTVEQMRKQQLVPLAEAKLEEETEWFERNNNIYDDEINIDEECKNEYEETESHYK